MQIGQITEYRYLPLGNGKKLEVKVSVDGRVTNWLPVKTLASSFLIEHIPVRIKDQVIVHNPFGNNEDGFVDRNLTYKEIPLPNDIDENKFYKLFEDGTIFILDTKTKEISLNTPCSITITTSKDVSLKCKNATVKASAVVVDSPSIDLGKGGKGVVTGECLCHFTGSPHGDVSSNTRSAK